MSLDAFITRVSLDNALILSRKNRSSLPGLFKVGDYVYVQITYGSATYWLPGRVASNRTFLDRRKPQYQVAFQIEHTDQKLFMISPVIYEEKELRGRDPLKEPINE